MKKTRGNTRHQIMIMMLIALLVGWAAAQGNTD